MDTRPSSIAAALNLAKIDRNTPNPSAERFFEINRTGEATGMFLDQRPGHRA